jgi:restriction endonuclease S subunit
MKALKVNFSDINQAMRFDGGYHLSEGTIYLKAIRKMPYKELDKITSNIFTAGRNKRVYTDEKFGYPYLSNSDVAKQNPLDGCKYNSKKFGYDETSFLKEGMILTGRVGAIGQTAYITSEFEEYNAMGSDNIIRIVPNKNEKSGYIYAFLTSKYGNTLFWKLAAGGVQPYISEEMLRDIPIPNLTETKQQEIHNLIVEASSLRVEANKLLNEAMEYFNSLKIDYKYGTAISRKISIRGISNGYKRFDSAYAIVSMLVEDSLQGNQLDYVTIRSQTSGIFIGPRAKRNYVTSGTSFLSTSAMQKANPTKVDKFISPKSSDGFIVEEGWILTTRSGTLGDTIYTLPCISGFAVSEDAIRVVLKEDAQISNEYLFAFLKSSIGKSSLLSGSYGSVILHLNENYIGDIKVPILAKVIIEEIEAKVGQHLKNMNEAILKENQAIDIVEKEIESWQK